MKSVPVEKCEACKAWESETGYGKICNHFDMKSVPVEKEKWDSLVVETTERLVIEYANLSGRESANRATFRMRAEEIISQAIQAAISVREKEISDEVIGAVARGWTHEVNAKKIMDSDLALAIEKEMYLVIHPIDHQ